MNNISTFFSKIPELPPGPPLLEGIPNESLVNIFTRLPVEGWSNLSQTSKFFAQKSTSPIVLASLFEDGSVHPNKLLEFAKAAGIFLTKFNSTKSKRGYSSIFGQWIPKLFEFCPNIQHLNLRKALSLTDKNLDNIPQNLESLDLSECDYVSDKIMEKLSKNLVSLKVSRWRRLTDATIDKLPQNLKVLDVSHSEHLTDAGISKLPKSLKVLKISDCRQVRGTTLDTLPEGLQSLTLNHRLTDDSAIDIRKISKTLLSLHLKDCYWLTDADISELSQDLKTLKLTRCAHLTEKGINKLPRDLQSLSLRESYIELNERIPSLHGLPKGLLSLDLTRCVLMRDENLKGLPEGLQSLDLTDCRQLTDAIIDILPKNLVSLNLHGCIGLTDEGRKKLAERFSSTNIKF
jgi:Leucine Rich repeat